MTKIAELAAILQEKDLKLAVAESCTGGLIAAGLTSVSGSSNWFDRGFVTYSNAAKKELLSVPAQTIEQYGAVSTETAIAMVQGVFNHSAADVALSVTGIAGPSGGTEAKPVGTVCFAYGIVGQEIINKNELFLGNRQEIRESATKWAYLALITLLKSI